MNARNLSKLIRLQRGPFRKSRITRCAGAELLADERHSCSDNSIRYHVQFKASHGGTCLGGGYYRPGQIVMSQAFPDRGYKFVGWMCHGMIQEEDVHISVVVREDAEWTAVFELLPLYTVVTESTDHRVDDILQGAGTYYKGETAHFWAPWTFEHPSWGHQVFNNWSRYHEGDPYSAWQMVSSRPEFEQVIEDNWIYKAQYVGM